MEKNQWNSPLNIYFNIWATLLLMGYRTFLLVALLAPMKVIALPYGGVTIGSLLFPLAYSILVVFFELYGYRLTRRLVVIGMGIFGFTLGVVLLLAYLPSPHSRQPILDAGTLTHIYIALMAGFIISNIVILLILKYATRVTGWALVLRLFIVPFLAYFVTIFVYLPIFYGPLIPHNVLVDSFRQFIFVTCFIAAITPAIFLLTKFVKRKEQQHHEQISKDLLAYTQQLAEGEGS